MDFNILMYYVFGITAIAGGLIMLFARHPIRSALGLLTSMLALAGMYAILQAHSIAAFQVIIYAGAVMVLIIYFIMLLDIKSDDYLRSYSKLFWVGGPVIAAMVALFIYKLYAAISGQVQPFAALNASVDPSATPKDIGSIRLFSSALLTKYVFAFEYVSTVLFAAIVAVISIVQLDWKGRKNE